MKWYRLRRKQKVNRQRTDKGKQVGFPGISQHHTEKKLNLQLDKAKLRLGRIQTPLRRF